MKQKLFTLAALASLASLVACQREESGNLEDGKLVIGLQMEDLSTKVDVDGNSGACTWTSGDRIGIFVVNESEGNAYHPVTVNTTSNTVHLAMTPEMSLSGYALTPYAMCDASDPAPTGATPRVHYLTTYSMEGLDLTSDSFSNIPMMAVNNASLLSFYHVGGLLRLILSNVPENTDKIAVEFVGMTHVCGKCTVTKPGTRSATTAITIGEGNTVTFTDVTRSASTMYLNVPLPSIDFSALTAIRIKAYDGSTLLASVSKSTGGSWGVFKHGYGRMQDVDFSADALSGVRLSSNADITLWKSKTVTRTATALDQYGLPYDDVTMEWSSSATSVATVNASTGLVTAVGPGETTITATATPKTGGTSKTASYTVNVNAITGISVTPNAYNVAPGNTITLTATLTNTNHGTINGYPSDLTVNWTSSKPSYVTVASASVRPVAVNATTMTATVSVNGVKEGSAALTATVAPAYADAAPLSDADNTVTCRIPTTITFPSGGEKYKFRGLYLHPGVLYWNGSAFSVTDGTDPLVLLQHYYYDSRNSKYGNSSGTPWVNCCYFTWTQLKQRLDGSSSDANITGTISAALPGSESTSGWRIPSAYESSLDTNTDFGKIIADTPDHSIKINSRAATTANTSNYVYVNVNLAGSPYAGKGLGYSTNIGNKAGDLSYQAGLLLIPDGAEVTCAGIQTSGYGSWNGTTASTSCNVISYYDLLDLVSGGCVFLPAAGYYNGSSWTDGGSLGSYWSSTRYSSSDAYRLYFSSNNYTGNINKALNSFPVLLVRK